MKRVCFSIVFILLFAFYTGNAQTPDNQALSTAAVHYRTAIDLLNAGRFVDASMHLQHILNWFPDSEFAKPALAINTLIYRLRVAPPADNRTYVIDSSYAGTVMELDEPLGLACDSQGNVYFTDKGKKSFMVFDPTGRQIKNSTLLSPYMVSANAGDMIYVGNDENVVAADGKSVAFSIIDSGGTLRPLEDIRSIATDSKGRYYIISNKFPGILVYGQDRSPAKDFAPLQKQYYKVLVNSRDEICAVDKDRKQITIFDSTGKALSTIGPAGKGYTIEKIEDFAVDEANNIYVLEKNPKSVLIFSSDGNILKYIQSDKKGTLAFEDARLLTVGPSGSIYILDKDSHRIMKIG